MQALRVVLLRRLRVPVSASSLRPTELGSSWPRRFSEEARAHATYLDRGQVTDRILNVVKTFQKVDPAKVSPTAHFQKDLGLDSLDTVEIVMAFEEEFALEIPDSDADNISSVGEAIDYIASHPAAK